MHQRGGLLLAQAGALPGSADLAGGGGDGIVDVGHCAASSVISVQPH